MTFVMFGCNRCGRHGQSFEWLLNHRCIPTLAMPLDATVPGPTAVVERRIVAPALAAATPTLVLTFKCAQCGQVVIKTGKRRKFCSRTCSVAFHNVATQAKLKQQRQRDPAKPKRAYKLKPLWPTANNPPAPVAEKLSRPVPPALPRSKHENTVSVIAASQTSGKASPAKRTRLESLFGAVKSAAPTPRPTAAVDGPHARDVWVEPERLPAGGMAPAQGQPTANPSHPVRSHIKPANWRRVTPERDTRRYCACGMALPVVVPDRCPECGRPVK